MLKITLLFIIVLKLKDVLTLIKSPLNFSILEFDVKGNLC